MVAGIISGRWKISVIWFGVSPDFRSGYRWGVTSDALEFRSVRAADAVHDRANLDRDQRTTVGVTQSPFH